MKKIEKRFGLAKEMPFYVDGTSNNITNPCTSLITALMFGFFLAGCVYFALQLTRISGTPSTNIRAHNTTALQEQLNAVIKFPKATKTDDVAGIVESKKYHSFSIAIRNTTENICDNLDNFV